MIELYHYHIVTTDKSGGVLNLHGVYETGGRIESMKKYHHFKSEIFSVFSDVIHPSQTAENLFVKSLTRLS